MAREVVVIGGGEHGRVVMEAMLSRAGEFTLAGYSDIARNVETDRRFTTSWLGSDDECVRAHPHAAYVLGIGSIGSAAVRKRVVEQYRRVSFAEIMHRDASVSPSATIASGAVIFARAVVNTGAVIGEHAVVNTGAIVEHDVVLGAHARIAPGVTIGGGAFIGEDAYVGLGACIRDHVRIGARAVVAMGAVVVDDVAEDAVVMGIPARVR